MEPAAAAFLKRIGKTLLIGFLWLALTCVFAIKGDNAFVNGPIRLGNVLFYCWFVASVIGLVYIFKGMWSDAALQKERDDFERRMEERYGK